MFRFGVLLGLAIASATPARAATALPVTLVPPAPFPLVLAQSSDREFVAPGITRGAYRLLTANGPLVVSFVSVDPREPTVRLGTVLAHDRIVSGGERVTSMAARTSAVAGINGDYFDIGNTNTPLGVLVQDGRLARTPSARAALTIGRDRGVRIEPYRFAGTAVDGPATIAVTGINEYPPQGGAALLTPAYGIPPAVAGVTLAELVPVAAGVNSPNGRYRVTQIDSGTTPAQPGFALALGAAARGAIAVQPDVGDLIDVAVDTDPPLATILGAIGGGPALLGAGAPVDDPLSPGYADRARRIPVAAAGVLADGSLVMLVVDGRHPQVSIGVDRAELIALLQGLGATDALQFDSGGSATLVARDLGDAAPTLQNEPSDGPERPVADGLFVYSDAPAGPPDRLVVRPARVLALPGATIPLRAAIVDAAGHPFGPAHGPWTIAGAGARIDAGDVLHVGTQTGTFVATVERGGVGGRIPIEVVPAVAKVTIVPDRPDVEPGDTVMLRVRAVDARDRTIAVGDRLRWSALRGTIDASGRFRAGAQDGFVTATVGGIASSEIVFVGRHVERIDLFDAAHRAALRFSTVPAGGPGGLGFAGAQTLRIGYDFSSTERAAYANAGVVVDEPDELSCAVDGDGNGAGLRVAFTDRFGERQALTLVKTIDFADTQRRSVRIPAALAPPLTLQSFYVIGSLGSSANHGAGTIGVHDCRFTLPGSARRTP